MSNEPVAPMKSFTSLAEFRYALLLALAVGGWLLLFRSWQQERAIQPSQHGWEGEATFVVIIPVYLLFLFTCFGALAYLSLTRGNAGVIRLIRQRGR